MNETVSDTKQTSNVYGVLELSERRSRSSRRRRRQVGPGLGCGLMLQIADLQGCWFSITFTSRDTVRNSRVRVRRSSANPQFQAPS